MKKIDIHNHILWGIDDGAKNKDESLEMLKLAFEDGVKEIIATPHFHHQKGKADPEKIRKLTAELQEAADEKKIPIKLHIGNELYYTQELLEQLQANACLTLADTKYLLLEFSVNTEPKKMKNAIYQLSGEGYSPIIAHIERYDVLVQSPELFMELADMGAYYQINAQSLIQRIGWNRRTFVKSAVKSGYVQFLATDAHHTEGRIPTFGKAEDWVLKKCGKSEASKILYENPRKLLENQDI